MGVNFDDWLTHELRRGVHVSTGHPPVPRYASLPAAPSAGLLHTLGAAAKSKAVITATALSVVAGGGVGAKVAVTGNADPFVWGQRVKQQVVTCKQDLAPGQHGIGTCVSGFARQHGVQARDQHSHGRGHGSERRASHGADHGKAHSHGRGHEHPARKGPPAESSATHGRGHRPPKGGTTDDEHGDAPVHGNGAAR
jgi:hypothetical protein